MKKSDELRLPDSCLNRAKTDEPLFVLLGRDSAAPAAIREWVRERIDRRKNKQTDTQIQEALQAARNMEAYWIALTKEQT